MEIRNLLGVFHSPTPAQGSANNAPPFDRLRTSLWATNFAALRAEAVKLPTGVTKIVAVSGRWLLFGHLELAAAGLLLGLLTMVHPATVAAQSPVEVTLVPAATRLNVDQTTMVEIRIGPAEDVYGAELHLDYDPARIAFVDQDPSRDGVQPASFSGSLLQPDFVALNTAADGRLSIAITQLAPAPAVSGPGLLATVEVVALAPGSTTLSFTETEGQAGVVISTPDGDALPAQGIPVTIEIASPAGQSPTQTPTSTATATQPSATATATWPPSATPTVTPRPASPTPMPSDTPTQMSPTIEAFSQTPATPTPTATLPASPTVAPSSPPAATRSPTPAGAVGEARATATPARGSPPPTQTQAISPRPTGTEEPANRQPGASPGIRTVTAPTNPSSSTPSRTVATPLLVIAGAIVLGGVAWLMLNGTRE